MGDSFISTVETSRDAETVSDRGGIQLIVIGSWRARVLITKLCTTGAIVSHGATDIGSRLSAVTIVALYQKWVSKDLCNLRLDRCCRRSILSRAGWFQVDRSIDRWILVDICIPHRKDKKLACSKILHLGSNSQLHSL